jgi:hypothetical protein
MSSARTPENPRWTRSAKKLEILYEIRGVWLELGLRTRSVVPVPEEWEHYFEDLRRGRIDIGATVARVFDTIERRRLGWEGRRAGEKILALLQRYLDLCVPADQVMHGPKLLPQTCPSGRVRGVRTKRRPMTQGAA